MDRDTVKALRAKIEAALELLNGETLKLRLGRASFDRQGYVQFALEVSEVQDGVAHTREASDFQRACARWGMKPDDLGREFESMGRRFTLLGAKLTNRKYPLIGEGTDGRRYKFARYQVKLIGDPVGSPPT